MSRPKVAHVTTVPLSLRYLLLNQMTFLRDAGYDVIGISSAGPEVADIEAASIRHIAVPMSRKSFTPLGDVRALWRLYRVMRAEHFTIVHTHTPKAGILGRLAAKMAGVPVIVHTHHGFIFHEGSAPLFRGFFTLLERVIGKLADRMFAVSREDAQWATKLKIAEPGQIRVLGSGLGIDLTLFDRDNVSDDAIHQARQELDLPHIARIIGFVGRLVREKGLPELLDAARALRERVDGELRLLIIGPTDTAKPDALTPEIATRYGVADICIFAGMRVREEMPVLYRLMDVFVLPSHREGFPLVLAEAAAMGVPTVATNIRGCREAIEHGRNGLLVPVDDAQALADAIFQVLDNQGMAQRMSDEARRIAVERFDERLVNQKVQEEYAALLKSKGLPVPTPQPVPTSLELEDNILNSAQVAWGRRRDVR
jgi:glycosyltransferase involved in cell wall biosynthesis